MEGAPGSSSEVSVQQQLESVGDVKPARQTHREKRWEKFLEMKRQRAPLKKDNMRFKRFAKATKDAITVPVELIDLRPSMKPRHEPRAHWHEELARLGIRTIQWDGLYALFPFSLISFSLFCFRDSIPIKTPSGIVIALLAGRPRARDWDERMKSLTGDFNATANSLAFPAGVNGHHRGDYPVMNIGSSYGGGSQVRFLSLTPA